MTRTYETTTTKRTLRAEFSADSDTEAWEATIKWFLEQLTEAGYDDHTANALADSYLEGDSPFVSLLENAHLGGLHETTWTCGSYASFDIRAWKNPDTGMLVFVASI